MSNIDASTRAHRQKATGHHGRFGELQRLEPSSILAETEPKSRNDVYTEVDRSVLWYRSDDDEFERDGAKWKAEAALSNLDHEEFEAHWATILDCADMYGDMSVPTASAIDAAVEANELAGRRVY